MIKDLFQRSDTWKNNQMISKKMYEELCDMKGIHPYGGEQRCPTCKKAYKMEGQATGSLLVCC